jgi:hypothetical protein
LKSNEFRPEEGKILSKSDKKKINDTPITKDGIEYKARLVLEIVLSQKPFIFFIEITASKNPTNSWIIKLINEKIKVNGRYFIITSITGMR